MLYRYITVCVCVCVCVCVGVCLREHVCYIDTSLCVCVCVCVWVCIDRNCLFCLSVLYITVLEGECYAQNRWQFVHTHTLVTLVN